MKQIKYELGQQVVFVGDQESFTGRVGTVTGLLEMREGFASGKRVAYRVQWADKSENPVQPFGLALARPTRGNCDQKVGWEWLPASVVDAIKGTKS